MDKGAHFLEQSIVQDHFDAGQCKRFRYDHCRFVSFFCPSGMGELFGVIATAGFSRNA